MGKINTLIALSVFALAFVSFAYASGVPVRNPSENNYTGQLRNNPTDSYGSLGMFRILEEAQLESVFRLNKDSLNRLALMNESHIRKIGSLDTVGIMKILYFDDNAVSRFLMLNDYELQKLSMLDIARIDMLSALSVQEMRQILSRLEITRLDSKYFFSPGISSEQKTNKAEERFRMADQNLAQSKKDLDIHMRLLEKAVQEKDEGGTINHSRSYLVSASDAIISHLEKVKNKVQQSFSLDEGTISRLTRDVNVNIMEIEGLKSSAANADDINEIKFIAKRINAAWRRIRAVSELNVRQIVNSKIGESILKSSLLEQKLEHILLTLSERNINITTLQASIGKTSSLVHDSRILLARSNEKYAEARSSGIYGEVESSILESKALSLESIGKLKQSYIISKDIIRDIRQLFPDVDFDNTNDLMYVVSEKQGTKLPSVRIEGFLKLHHRKLIDALVKDLARPGTNANISIEMRIDEGVTQLKKQVEGNITSVQKEDVRKLVDSLEDIDDQIKITFSAGG